MAVKAGKRVAVRIDPEYKGASRRPYKIDVSWTVNGTNHFKTFPNQKEK